MKIAEPFDGSNLARNGFVSGCDISPRLVASARRTARLSAAFLRISKCSRADPAPAIVPTVMRLPLGFQNHRINASIPIDSSKIIKF